MMCSLKNSEKCRRVTGGSGAGHLHFRALLLALFLFAGFIFGFNTSAFAGSSPVTVTVSGPTSSTFGTSLAYRVTVSPVSTSSVLPSGPVSISLAGYSLVSGVMLDATGAASITLTAASISALNLTPGQYTLEADYYGDDNFANSFAQETLQLSGASTLSSAVSLSASNTTPALNEHITLTANVAPVGAGGTVTFFNTVNQLTTSLGSASLLSGTATLSASFSDTYTHYITASYSGDGVYASSVTSTFTTIQPTQLSSSFTINSLATSTVAYGDSVTLSTSDLPSGATGTVKFLLPYGTDISSGYAYCTTTVNNGVASCSITISSSFTLATHVVSAQYSGDKSYLSSSNSNTSAVSVTLKPANPTLTVNLAPASVAYGTNTNVTATLLPAPPAGESVAFSITSGGVTTSLGTSALNSGGEASLSLPATYAPGTYTVSAVYTSDTKYNSASGSASLTISTAATAVTVTGMSAAGSSSSAIYGASVTLTATLGQSAATGTIQFIDNNANLSSRVTVSGGKATLTTSALAIGTHAISAAYVDPTGYYTAGPVTSLAYAITQIPTTGLTLAVSAGAVPTSGQTLSLTASGLASGASGTITVTEGGTTVATGTVNSGGAVMTTTSALTAGPHSYIATYGGDGTYLGSSSSALSVTAKTTSTGLTLAVSTGAVPTSGQTLSLTASGLASGASGTITVKDNGTTVATGTVSSGGAVMTTTSALTAGPHSYVATYTPDSASSYLGSSSSALSVTAKTATTNLTLALTSGAVATIGQTLTLTASGLPSGAAGTIIVKDGSGKQVASGTVVSVSGMRGAVMVTTSALTVASNSFTAFYSGDDNYYSSSSSPLSVTAKAVITSFTLTLPTGAVPTSGNSLSLKISGLPGDANGTITLTEGSWSSSVSVTNGVAAALTTSTLTAGSHTFTATYSDSSGKYSVDTATLTFIAQVATTINVTLSPTVVTYGNPMSVKASVAAVSPVSSSTPALSGQVMFWDNGTLLNTLSLGSDGTISFSKVLSLGKHEISAKYVGNTYYLASYVDPGGTVVRGDPTVNADVRGIFTAQVAATQHIAQVTQSTVNGRLESLHDDDVPEFANGLSFSNAGNAQQPGQPDSFLGLNQNNNDNFLDKIASLYKKATTPTSPSQTMRQKLIRPDYNIWTAGSIVFGNQNYTGQTTHSTFSMSGVTAGIDRRFTSQFRGGLALGLSAETTNINTNGAYNKTKAATASLYGSYNLGNSLFLDGQIGYGAARFTTSRTDHTDPNVSSLMTGKRPGQLLIGSFTLSSEQKAGKLKYAPYARVDFMKAMLNAYQEQGDAKWMLAYNKMSVSSAALVLGLRGQYDFAMDFGTLSPTLRAEYNYNFLGSALQNLSYAQNVSDISDNVTYSLSQSSSRRSGMTLAAGVKAAGGHNLSGSMEYVVTTTGVKVQGQTVRAAVNHAF